MAAHLIVASLVALFCIAQPGLSRPEQAGKDPVQDLIKEMESSFKKSLDEAKKTLNLPENPNGENIVKAMKENMKKAETAINDMRTKVEQQIKSNPQIQEAIKGLQSKIEEAQNKLKKENPEVAANAQKMMDQMKTAYESVTKEMEKVNAEVNKKGGLKDDVDNLLKMLIDRAQANAKELQASFEKMSKKA